MITDDVLNQLKAYLETRSELSTLSIQVREEGSDLTYPALILVESSQREHEILRGQWTVEVDVILKTRPEDDESASTHQSLTSFLHDFLGDHLNLKEIFSPILQCWDSWGGAGVTTVEDGFRETTFTLELSVSAAA